MKILVPIKRVPDGSLRVRVLADGGGVDLAGLKMAMNPFDEIALEEALRLREAGVADEVVMVSCGPLACQETLRTGLAMGGDRAILVETSSLLQPLSVAKLLKCIALREVPDLVLMGKQAIDDDANQTGQLLAAMLGWPQACFASRVSLGEAGVDVTRETDAGTEVLSMGLPAVVTADLRLNVPRYVTLPNVMKARKKEIEVLPADSLSVDLTPRLEVLRVEAPQRERRGICLNNVEDLAAQLKAELARPGGVRS